MNVSELFELTYWIDDNIVRTQIPQKYQNLYGILQQYTQPNHPKQPFETQKNDLINSLEKVPLDQLTKDQINFLCELGIAEAVGNDGIQTLEDILYKNVIDVATSAQKIQQIFQKINKGIDKSKKIKEGLDGCVSKERYEEENEVLMRVNFTGNAAMLNIVDFHKCGEIWLDIGRGIAVAHDSSPEEVKIVGATKGSIIFELAVARIIANTASNIVFKALEFAEKILNIRIKAEELRSLKLKNDKIARELEKEADNEKKGGIEEISAEIIKEIGLQKKDNVGDKINALKKAVEKLVDFIDRGGEVDFVISKEEVVDNEEDKTHQQYNKELRIKFQEIRKLENKIKLIEYKAP